MDEGKRGKIHAHFFMVLACVGLIFLQCFLSRQPGKFLGLLFPGIAFLISLLYVFNVAAVGSPIPIVFFMISTFLSANISTAVLLAIYFFTKAKQKAA